MDVVKGTLEKANSSGIVDFADSSIPEFTKNFAIFSNKVRLSVPVPGSNSTYQQFLDTSGLNDSNSKAKFSQIYLNHDGNANHLWDNAKKAGLNDVDIGRLQLQGKMAFLSGSSQAMTTS